MSCCLRSLWSVAQLIVEGLAAVMGAAWPVVAAMGGLAGFFLPQIGTMARVRWRAMGAANPTMEAGILETSFAWEGAIDEASFALGPAAVGALAVLAGPVPGLSSPAPCWWCWGVGLPWTRRRNSLRFIRAERFVPGPRLGQIVVAPARYSPPVSRLPALA